jgi:hypothetical protein
MMFMFGLYLMFSKMTVREKRTEIVADSADRIVERISNERAELIRRKMSVVATNVEKSSTRVQTKASPGATATDLNRPFNVSLWIDNTPGGGGKGEVVILVLPALAPIGARRFAELVEARFFDGCRFFRVLHNFMGQFGINGEPSVQEKWRGKAIRDDPVRGTNKRGAVTFATSGPNR